MIAIAGRILIMIDEKTDFLVTDETLSAAKKAENLYIFDVGV